MGHLDMSNVSLRLFVQLGIAVGRLDMLDGSFTRLANLDIGGRERRRRGGGDAGHLGRGIS